MDWKSVRKAAPASNPAIRRGGVMTAAAQTAARPIPKAAANAGLVAAQAGDLVAYADALGAIGKNCGACHGKYRGK